MDDEATLRRKEKEMLQSFVINTGSKIEQTFCLVDLPISACGNCSTAGVTHCVKDGGLMMSSTTVSLASVLFCGVSRMVPFSVKSRDRPGNGTITVRK